MNPNSLIHGMRFIIGRGEKSCCRALGRLVSQSKEGGGEEVASNEHIRRVIEEIEKMRRQKRNSKLKINRRIKNLEKSLDPLERQRTELEIELLKRKILRWEIVETKLSISIIKATLFEGGAEAKIDWSKAGEA